MVAYTDRALVQGTRVTETPFNRSATGYGGKLPTRHMVKYDGRWHRVYAMCYGNAASVYILHHGLDLFIDIDTEYELQEATQ